MPYLKYKETFQMFVCKHVHSVVFVLCSMCGHMKTVFII